MHRMELIFSQQGGLAKVIYVEFYKVGVGREDNLFSGGVFDFEGARPSTAIERGGDPAFPT
jgi:hypothetical protein